MEHVHSEHVETEPDRVFEVLSDPARLGGFVPQLTRVEQRGEEVAVEARYEGQTHQGEAYFRADPATRRVEWGTDSGYRGWFQVEPDGDGSMLTLGLHTTHVEHADQDIAGTLDAIRRLMEARA